MPNSMWSIHFCHLRRLGKGCCRTEALKSSFQVLGIGKIELLQMRTRLGSLYRPSLHEDEAWHKLQRTKRSRLLGQTWWTSSSTIWECKVCQGHLITRTSCLLGRRRWIQRTWKRSHLPRFQAKACSTLDSCTESWSSRDSEQTLSSCRKHPKESGWNTPE